MAKKMITEVFVPTEEQPYSIPRNWGWIRLKAVCSDFIVPQRDKPKVFDGNIPWCRIEDIEGKYLNGTKSGQYVSNETIKEMNLRVCPIGTVICSCSASLGVQAILTTQCCTNQTFIGLVCSDLIQSEYLYYFLRSLDDYWQQIGTGTTIKYISRNKFEMLNTPVPPLPEQRRIVDRIESLFAKLDEAKGKAQAVVDGSEERKAAILHQAFTGELTGCTSELKTVHILDLIKPEKDALKAGPFGSSLKKSMYVDRGYKIYGQEQVINGDEDIGNYYIDEEKYRELYACRVAPGDILISLVGTVGKVLVLSTNCKPGIINPRLIKVSLDETKMLPWFFKYYFESGYIKSLYKADAHGSTMDVLNMGILKKLPFPLFSINSQKEIVNILDDTLQKEQQTKKAAEQVISQIDTMKKAILARAFRGELGTNDPSEPPVDIGIS